MEKQYYRVPEIAKYTGLSVHTVKSYVLNKKIPFIKVNGVVVFNVNDIDSWLDNHRVTPLSDRKSNGG